jgi:hypothetical protein
MKPRDEWGPADELADAIMWGTKAAGVVALLILCLVSIPIFFE